MPEKSTISLEIPKEFLSHFIHYLRTGLSANGYPPTTREEVKQVSEWYRWCEEMKRKHLVKKDIHT